MNTFEKYVYSNEVEMPLLFQGRLHPVTYLRNVVWLYTISEVIWIHLFN
jgi:hypothetical protein